MSIESVRLIRTLKLMLHSRGLTYADLAPALELSESSVKRVMSSGDMSIERLAAIVAAMDSSIEELVRMSSETKTHSELTLPQEEALAKDPTLLTYFYLVLAGWSPQRISERYEIEDLETIRLQSRLDRLGLIEALPLGRIRLLTERQIAWRKDGPVRRAHQAQALGEFLDSRFNQPEERLETKTGELSHESITLLNRKISELDALFEELATTDTPLPPQEKQGTGLMVAMRPWVFSVFRIRKR